MPSPRNGNAGVLIGPANPIHALPADDADPGRTEKLKWEQRQRRNGKYGSVAVPPLRSPENESEFLNETGWIEIELVDDLGHPVPGEKYIVIAPNGMATGTLNENGFVRLNYLNPGQCRVIFPELDRRAVHGV